MKVATNTLSTTWLTRSRRKFRNRRGENCVDASCSATTVRPSTSAMTVTIVLAMPISRLRASSTVPWKTRCFHGDAVGSTSTADRADPTASASTMAAVGNNQRDPCRRSRIISRRRCDVPAHERDLRPEAAVSAIVGLLTGWVRHARG